MLLLRARVDLGAMAIKGYSIFLTGTSPLDCLVSYPGHLLYISQLDKIDIYIISYLFFYSRSFSFLFLFSQDCLTFIFSQSVVFPRSSTHLNNIACANPVLVFQKRTLIERLYDLSLYILFFFCSLVIVFY